MLDACTVAVVSPGLTKLSHSEFTPVVRHVHALRAVFEVFEGTGKNWEDAEKAKIPRLREYPPLSSPSHLDILRSSG